MTVQKKSPSRFRWQFSLRTLLTLMLAVACFLGGWMANEWKRQRDLDRAADAANLQFTAPVQVERLNNTNTIVVRGKKADVERMQEVLTSIEDAAAEPE